jgi:hypothetical protein
MAEQISFTDNAHDVTVIIDHRNRGDLVVEQEIGDFGDARIGSHRYDRLVMISAAFIGLSPRDRQRSPASGSSRLRIS